MGILDNLFGLGGNGGAKDERVPGDWDREKPSLGVIACDGHEGVVLWYVGGHLGMEIEETGLRQLGDLGLDDAPHGISIWEGRYVWSRGPFEHPEDGDMTPRGKFRSPTDEEWEAIRAGRCPWNEEDWRVR